MTTEWSKESLSDRLGRVAQPHLLAFWDQLDAAGQQRLARQIADLDLDQLTGMLRPSDSSLTDQRPSWEDLASRATAPPAFRLHDPHPRITPQEAEEAGQQALRDGKLGMILVAGGQGTRLGFDHPKGMFPFGPVSRHPLFQIFFERLIAVGRRFDTQIPLYLMTSPATHEATVQFLEEHQRFGLAADQLRIFCQATLPAIDDEGKILLAAKDTIALAPDGHGGMLAALTKSGCLTDAESRGATCLFYGQVDNPLLQICDPKLVGYHLLSGSELTSQVVDKAAPLERVGNLVAVDETVLIIEYSDLPDRYAQQRNSDGTLKLWAGSIAVHVFSVDFLRRMTERPDALPLHRARKKVPFIDQAGEPVDPSEPNATKFERFIFDLLPHAHHAVAVEADRATVFAPVKNANTADADTPQIAQAMMIAQHRAWLEQAGAVVQEGVAVEISPLFALDPDDVVRKLPGELVVQEDQFFA